MARKNEEKEPKEPVDKKPVEPADDGTIEVDLSEPEGDDGSGDDDGDDDAQPAPRQSNSQRRASRYREEQERAARLQQENEQLRQASLIQAQQYQQWLQSQQAGQQQQQQNEEVKKIFREQEDAYAAFKALEAAGALNETTINQYKERFQDIEIRKYHAMQRATGSGGQQMTPQQVMAINQQQQLMGRYGDVLQHQQAGGWAYGTWYARVRAGEQDSEALRDEIAEEARKRFGMPSQVRRAAPTPNNRAKYTGMSAGANGSARASASGGNTMTLSKDDVKMAVAMYPKKPQKEAVRLYAANLAKRRQQKGA